MENVSKQSEVTGDILADIIKTVSQSDGFFKHQQIGEPDLTQEEKAKIATDLVSSKPAVFLSRYGKFLSEDHLSYFEQLKTSNYETEFYLNEARQNQCRFIKQNKVRNRRYAAMRKMLQSNDDYFSESSMKARNPLLYEQLIGRFMTEEEKEAEARPDMSNCSLTNIILDHIDLNKERDDKKRMKEEEEEEEFDTDEESSNEEESLGRVDGGKEFLRKQFVKSSIQSFLEGKDVGFDYRRVDNDESLDDLDIVQMDAEERYFEDSDNDE